MLIRQVNTGRQLIISLEQSRGMTHFEYSLPGDSLWNSQLCIQEH